MSRLLSLSLFLICLFSIESKGDINKTLSRISVAPTVNDTVIDLFFDLTSNLTPDEMRDAQVFIKINAKRAITEDFYGDLMIIHVINNRFGRKTLEMWNFSDGDQFIRMFKTKRKWLK